MSFFVLIYDRPAQKIVEFREYSARERAAAEGFRLEAQREALRTHRDQEIVLFEAPSREALQRTHGSYFHSVAELLGQARDAAEAV